MDLMLIDLLESSKAIGLCPMGMNKKTVKNIQSIDTIKQKMSA